MIVLPGRSNFAGTVFVIRIAAGTAFIIRIVVGTAFVGCITAGTVFITGTVFIPSIARAPGAVFSPGAMSAARIVFTAFAASCRRPAFLQFCRSSAAKCHHHPEMHYLCQTFNALQRPGGNNPHPEKQKEAPDNPNQPAQSSGHFIVCIAQKPQFAVRNLAGSIDILSFPEVGRLLRQLLLKNMQQNFHKTVRHKRPLAYDSQIMDNI